MGEGGRNVAAGLAQGTARLGDVTDALARRALSLHAARSLPSQAAHVNLTEIIHEQIRSLALPGFVKGALEKVVGGIMEDPDKVRAGRRPVVNVPSVLLLPCQRGRRDV
jgi:hypothetical protein